MSSNSATLIPTQQSVKAYVDSQVTAQDLDATTDSGTIDIDLDSETLTIAGGEGIDTSATGTTITIAGEDASTSNKGVASFSSTFFSVSSGAVSLVAAQTGITSLLATDIKIGEDDQTKIDFETADEIHFYAANAHQILLSDGVFRPQTDSDVDLGHTSTRWKNAYIDTITTTGNVSIGGDLDVTGSFDMSDANITNIGSIALDTITNDGTDITLDSSGTIILDADTTGQVEFKDGGVSYGSVNSSGGTGMNLVVSQADNNFEIWGTDGSTIIKAVEVSMADDGATTFKSSVTATSFVGALTGNVTGDVSGNAGTVTVSANQTNNETVYLTFVDGATGSQGLETDTALSYNPSTNILTTNSLQAGNITIDGNDISTSSGNLTITPQGTSDLQVNSDRLAVRAAEGESATLLLASDEQDDDGDTWKVTANTDNTFVIQNDVSGSADVTHFSITPHATVANSTVAIAGGVTVGGTLGVTGVVTANAGVVVDNITIDGNNITTTNTNGSLTLDVAGNIILDSANNGETHFYDSGLQYAQISASSGNMLIAPSGADKDILFKGTDSSSVITALTLDMSEAGAATFNSNVGVGVSPSTWNGTGTALQIEGAGHFVTANEYAYIGANYYYNSGWKYTTSEVATLYQQADGAHLFFNAASGSANGAITWSEKMRIDNSGNVGIGTSTMGANSRLTIAGADNSNYLAIRNTSASDGSTYRWGYIRFEGTQSGSEVSTLARIGAFHDGSADDQRGAFTIATNDGSDGDNPTEHIRLSSYGSLMLRSTVNTTGVFGAAKFFINAENLNNGIIVDRAREGYTGYGFEAENDTGTRYPMYIVNGSGTAVGSISMTSSATSFNTSSDYRLKENINYNWDATSTIKQLKPCEFNFKTDADNTVTGFLAHEAQSIVSNCVIGEKDKVNDKGNAEYQSIDHSKLVPLLVKTIQELEARIAKLEGG
tara:strand:+ start:2 stop:2848 length:2847 start_codon:yes stop_codon:yes gene_type:complete